MTQLTKSEIIELIDKAVLHNSVRSSYPKAVLKALQEAGVLMLVEGEAKEGDLVEHSFESQQDMHDLYYRFYEPNKYGYPKASKIFQRANTPVYQCKKEN